MSRQKSVIVTPDWVHVKYMLRYLGIRNEVLQLQYGSSLVVDGYVTFVNWHQSDGNEGGRQWLKINRGMFKHRQRLFNAIQPNVAAQPQSLILIKRAQNKARAWGIKTAAELEINLQKYCDQRGLLFVIFDPHKSDESSTDELEHRIRLFGSAVCVVSVHGGANYNIFFCPKGASFVEVTMPDTFLRASCEWWVNAAYIQYRRLVATSGHHSNICPVNIDTLKIMQALP